MEGSIQNPNPKPPLLSLLDSTVVWWGIILIASFSLLWTEVWPLIDARLNPAVNTVVLPESGEFDLNALLATQYTEEEIQNLFFCEIPTIPEGPITTISAPQFEADYGLKVRLVAVTGGGGMVDLRLKVVDAELAEQVIADDLPNPVMISDDGIILAQAGHSHGANLRDGFPVLYMAANSGYSVAPGETVTIIFGNNTQIENIPVH